MGSSQGGKLGRFCDCCGDQDERCWRAVGFTPDLSILRASQETFSRGYQTMV